MKKNISITLICVAVMAMSFVLVQNWTIANEKITFKIKSALGMVDGTISGLKGTVSFDPNNLPASNFDVTLDISTITTGNNKRDKDIREETTWFDMAKFPKIAFKSNAVNKTTGGYTVDGMLTIKGTAKKVRIPFTFTDATGGGIYSGTLKLNRLDYGVGKSTVMVKDTVEVVINVPVKK